MKYYANMKKKDGQFYLKTSLISIRIGLQTHFIKMISIDVINDQYFKGAKEAIKVSLVKVKREGKDKRNYKEEDRVKCIR